MKPPQEWIEKAREMLHSSMCQWHEEHVGATCFEICQDTPACTEFLAAIHADVRRKTLEEVREELCACMAAHEAGCDMTPTEGLGYWLAEQLAAPKSESE